jgi:hypothetical protein
MLFYQFPEDARWDEASEAVVFSVILGPYEGTVRVPQRVFQDSSISARHRSDASRRTTSNGPGSS